MGKYTKKKMTPISIFFFTFHKLKILAGLSPKYTESNVETVVQLEVGIIENIGFSYHSTFS